MKISFLKKSAAVLLGMIIGFIGMSVLSTSTARSGGHTTSTAGSSYIHTGNEDAIAVMVDDINTSRVIYIGETHNKLDHHMNQLAVINELHGRGSDIAIGVEFFQRPFQKHIDEYISGKISEKVLLKKTGYYSNWGYDYRLYRPILEYARHHQIDVIALNAPNDLVAQVSSSGFEGVIGPMKKELPDIKVQPNDAYKQRLRKVFNMHSSSDGNFKNFIQVQLLWDEYMAESAARFLQQYPNRLLVVLAGSGHVAVSSGIPQRVQRIVPHDYSVLVNVTGNSGAIEFADHILLSSGDELPIAGSLGMHFREETNGVSVMRILHKNITNLSANIRPGDIVRSIAGEKVRSMEDVRLAMLDRLPGEQIWIEIERTGANDKLEKFAAVIELI